jgi:hypothetical protein
MKRLILCAIVAMVCLGGVATVSGQGKGKDTFPTQSLSNEVCKAVQQYIASVSAAAAIKDKARRDENYGAARKALESVVKDRDTRGVLTEAAAYAQYTELAAVSDPTAAGFSELLEKRSKSSSTLLDMCMSHTLSR